MQFIEEIHEARMTRDASNARVLTYTDCCERLYLSLLIVELLRRFPRYSSSVADYASRTTRYANYNSFKAGGTDLYNFIYFVSGPPEAQDKLKNPGAAKEMRKRTYFSTAQVNGYLTSIGHGNNPNNALSILLSAEQSLNITNSDYKTLRRTIHNFDNLSTTEKKKNVTRLLYATRAKLRSSDIIDDLEKLAVEGNFETGLVKDNEPTISLPDIPLDSKDVTNYKFLVGTKNLMLAQKFIDLASKKASVPGNYIVGYLPIIKMVHDIVRAGPAFINQLRVLHKRAQKSTKE
jgi:hypothetical protein